MNNMTVSITNNIFGNISYVIIIFLTALVLLPPNVSALPNWQAEIKVESGSASNRLTIGAYDNATDGYDPIWDTNALLGGSIEAYFQHAEWNRIHDVFQRDIRAHAPGIAKTWSLIVNSTLTDSNFTLKWNPLNIPAQYPVVLFDESTGRTINLRSSASYDFIYTVTRSFNITITELTDTDNDGTFDDGDGSGIAGDSFCKSGNTANCDDNCKNTSNPDQADADNDGVGDICDNCRLVSNTDQTDDNYPQDDNTSINGEQHYGDVCDPDFDNDGLVRLQDYAIWRQYYRQAISSATAYLDLDGDGLIGLSDYSIWRRYYRNVPGPGIGD